MVNSQNGFGQHAIRWNMDPTIYLTFLIESVIKWLAAEILIEDGARKSDIDSSVTRLCVFKVLCTKFAYKSSQKICDFLCYFVKDHFILNGSGNNLGKFW